MSMINDPYPLFGQEADHKTSQRTAISLYRVLSHFSSNVEDFNIIGFSIGSHKSITKRKYAYGRKHVMAAVMINLQKSKGIEYNPLAWAMEDIDFNLRTDELSSKHKDQGVIVKCLRYVAFKKRIREGGVVPCDVPDEVMKMMEETEEWAGVGTRKKVGQAKNQVKHTEKEEKGEKSKGTQHAKQENHSRTEKGHTNENLEQSEEEKSQQIIEDLKSKKAEIARKRLALDKEEAEIARKRMELDQEEASLAAQTGESIPLQGKAGNKKRPQAESVDVEMEKSLFKRLSDAEESNLLPEGLVKKNGTKVDCSRSGCDDCEYIPKPFHHFAMNNQNKKCTCHICQLYESEDIFPTLAKIYVKRMKSRPKKPKR